MSKSIISTCPICQGKLIAPELYCTHCDTSIKGNFNLSKFDYLTPIQQEFILIFIKNAGNIKAVENDLNISYPTVKKTLNEIIQVLGFDEVTIVNPDENEVNKSKEEILAMLKRKEITFNEAEQMLKEIKK